MIYFHFLLVVPVDQGAGMTTNEVLQVVDSMPPGPEGMIVAVPGSVGALEPDAIDTTTLLSQVNTFLVHYFYQNCSDLLWEKIVLVIKKHF